MKAYLLLLGANCCHDGDEFQGIFTDIKALKEAYEQLVKARGIGYDSYLKPKIYEFRLNTMDRREHLLSADEFCVLVEEEIRNTGRKLIGEHIGALTEIAE